MTEFDLKSASLLPVMRECTKKLIDAELNFITKSLKWNMSQYQYLFSSNSHIATYLSIEEFGKVLEDLFIELTKSQADGKESKKKKHI